MRTHPDFARLLYDKIPEVAEITSSPDEVRELIGRTDPWAAYAAAIAYEFKVAESRLSRRERDKLPGGPDLRQAVYLGLVGSFAVRDQGLRDAAAWISPRIAGGARKVFEPSLFFQKAWMSALSTS